MKSTINLIKWEFTFEAVTSKCNPNLKAIVIYYHDTTLANPLKVYIKEEQPDDVMPYQAAFNADYTVEDLPEEIFDALHDSKLLATFKEWLTINYNNYSLIYGGDYYAEKDNQSKY